MTSVKLFLDSDVVISSIISRTGAAYSILISPKYTSFISNYSKSELIKVAKKTNLNIQTLSKIIDKNTKIHNINKPLKLLREEYNKYIKDENDAHIVAGAAEVKVDFLLTYNLKDFQIDRIRSDFNILVLSPGKFLQYLRSLDKF